VVLQIGYIGLTILINLILLFIGIKAINAYKFDVSKNKRKKTLLVSSVVIWQLYIFTIASTGTLENFDFPPRFVVFLIIPAFLFTGIFIYKNRNYNWIQHIPKQWLVYYQTFRIAVETLLALTATAGILHSNVTIHGFNYDMVFAFTAPFVAFLLFRKKPFKKEIVIFWNYLGLAVITSIIFLFFTTIYVPQMYGNETNLISTDFGKYPYVLVPGFLMPSAVFIHILSIVQLSKASSTTVN
jgi:hypothetical protein